ncbi:MAG: transcription termination/antitermination factor NusG [Ruminococcaceae bacterium]|nr:transcription termination/antitermination factor NusG [Oscillospiraceae bacterium]
MSEKAQWYVVHTYSGYENKVADNLHKIVDNRKLQDLIQEVRIPIETVTEIKEKKDGSQEQVTVERKAFPGYVLIKMVMTNETWYAVRNVRGVTGFVGPDAKPVPISDSEVELLGFNEKKVFNLDYEVGDAVRIIDGMFEDSIGTVEEILGEEGKVRVTLTMFGGRDQSIEFDLEQVEKMDF